LVEFVGGGRLFSMDKSTWVSPEDREITRANAMRQRFLARTSTILDPRVRRIGLDVNTIQAQIAERKQREAREKARDDAFVHQELVHQRLLLESAENERQQRRRVSQSDDRFRTTLQRADQSREYDIWRPDLRCISRPARTSDNESALGLSSGQVFQGEDQRISERLADQARQRTEWLQEQVRERAAIQRREQTEDLQNQLVQLETQKRLSELEQQTEIGRAAVRRQIAGDNLNMAQERRRREDEARAAEQRMEDAELRENARSATITERMGRRGGAPMEYRGMTVDEQKEVIAEQARQVDENQTRRRDESQRDEQWRQYQEYIRAQGDLAEAQWRRKTAQEQEEVYRTHLQQQAEFQERERRMNRDVYGTNVPDDSYYNQWGRSIR
jgi:hypothetical protein